MYRDSASVPSSITCNAVLYKYSKLLQIIRWQEDRVKQAEEVKDSTLDYPPFPSTEFIPDHRESIAVGRLSLTTSICFIKPL